MSQTPLKRVRLADSRKPSQDDVAAAVGITQSFYLRLENGERAASPELAESIAKYFSVRVSEIFTPARFASSLQPETAEV